MSAKTKQADSKGRIHLGERFANRHVIINAIDETAVTVTMARVIPEREAWLYDNSAAKAAVMQGLEEARDRKFADAPPDLEADAKLLDSIPDEE